MNLVCAHDSWVCLLEQQTAKMAEGEQTRMKSPAAPTLKELSNALDSVVNWHLLGVKLGLQDHELRTIEQNYRGDSERCKHEVLSRWLRNAKLATWKTITDALQQMGEHTVALNIQAKYYTDTDMALTQQSMSTADASEVPSSSNSSSAIGSQVSIQSPPHMVDSLVLAKENLQKIKFKYASLLSLALSVLQGKNIDMSIFRVFLTALYLPEEDSNDTKEINASRFIAEVLGSAQNLGEIFQSLLGQGLMSYKNCYVLRSIIDRYASDEIEMKKELREYEEALAGYVLVVKMKDYLDAALQQGEQSKPDPKLFDELSVKLNANITDKTMKYMSELWDSLAHRIKVPVTALPFHKVAKGCIEITWLVPFHLTHFTTRRLQESSDYFRQENIIQVTIAGRCVYEELPPVQESARKVEADPEKKEDPDDPDAGNLSPLQRIEQLIDDEPEGPEGISEHEQYMKCSRVIRTNYSLLYGHLDAGKLLPKLPDKDLINDAQSKAAESYQQTFAKNAVVIEALLKIDRPSHGLLKFCDTLETTPGQEHLGRKLLKDYKHPSPVHVHSPSADTAVHSDLSETSELFQQLQHKVMDLLDQFPNVLAKLKQVLASLVLPLGEGKVAPLVEPLAYENTQTVRELFRLMASYWNPLSTDLLGLLLEASGCNQAASKVAEFVEARSSKGHLVLCIHQLPTLASGENDLDVADFETVHNAPLSELQSLHPAVFARLPEHKVTSTRTTVHISVEVNKPLLCIADYEEITTALSGFFRVPKAALVYAGCSKAPLVLCWLASHELVAYIKSIEIGVSGHRLLAENKVTGVAVGDQIYKCPTIKEVELWEACQYGLEGQVHHFLTTGVNVNVTQFDGFSPLYLASQEGFDRIVKRLLQAGATVDLQNKNSETALDRASYNGHHKVVELLLGAGANPDLQDKDGRGPLYDASQKGYDRIVKMLLQAGATVDLQQKDGATPLRETSIRGHQKVVRLLLGSGANPDLQDKDGFFPLYLASQEGHNGIVEMLLQAGATVDLQQKEGVTPLYIACEKGHLPVVECLITAKADVNHQKKDGWTPLHITCQKGHILIVECLITAKADVNYQKKDGVTALMIAAGNGHPSVVRVLLQAGATINTTTQFGETALHFAVDREHEDIVDLLLEENADPDLPKKESQETTLMVAAKKGNLGIVRKLMKHGATINLTNKDGNTAYDLASFEGHTDVCQELLTQQS